MKRLFVLFVLLLGAGSALWLPFSCGGDASHLEATPSGDRMEVFTSILPLQYFVDRIGGDFVAVSPLVQPGQSPATHEISPRQMEALSRAKLFFAPAFPFERSLLAIIGQTCPDLDIVDLREGIALLEMAEHHHGHDHDHHHGHGHQCEGHGEKDPHFWLDPVRMQTVARSIAAALIRSAPAHQDLFESNRDALIAELGDLNARIKAVLQDSSGEILYVFHPSYGYFADAFALKQESIEVGGKEPGAKQVQQIVARMKAASAKAIFVQPQFSTQLAESIASATGAKVIALDPLAYAYPENLETIARQIAETLGRGHE